MVDCVALTKKYFEVWNAHDVAGIKALHAAKSTLTDWDASRAFCVSNSEGALWLS